MSAIQTLEKKKRKSRKKQNADSKCLKPSHAKKNSLKSKSKSKSSKSAQSPSKKKKKKKIKKKNVDLKKSPKGPKRPQIISRNKKKINDASFYRNNPALVNTKLLLYPYINWNQYVNQYTRSTEELLQIEFKGCDKRIDNLLETPNKQISSILVKSHKIYMDTMRGLFKPYFDIQSILNIILSFNGPHLLPIRYSIDLLPYFHSTVRQQPKRNELWNKAIKDKKSGQCEVDFNPKHNIMIIEDIYDEWIAYIRNEFALRSQYKEEALFYIPNDNIFMTVHSSNTTNAAKNAFTRLYVEALCNFNNCKEYAFRLDLVGINYYYYYKKQRSYSPISWGSRSRCWDGQGMVLLSDGTKKPIKDLSVGDNVAVLESLPNGVKTGYKTGSIKVKIESIVNRKYDMVLVNNKLWITPYHAVLNNKLNEWKMPCHLNKIEERFEKSIFNFILDRGHVLCVNGVWGCTLGHDLRGDVIENPIWGSSQVMHDVWSKKSDYPNIVEYI